ncbi:MAG: YcgN family cysteine cluster protein [Desulfosarcinaceae bacterium]|nr:YcgN family cysteine cluster protein [Desulfosarcinaceae bacterium]
MAEPLAQPFWETTPLDRMTPDQWESLCDGCGRCCLEKFQDPKTGKVDYCWVACYLLDTQSCRCSDYDLRRFLVPDCLQLRPETVGQLRWLPRTCAYRRLAEGKSLAGWHPLVTGDPTSVHRAGISVRDKAISAAHVHPDDVAAYLIKPRLW